MSIDPKKLTLEQLVSMSEADIHEMVQNFSEEDNGKAEAMKMVGQVLGLSIHALLDKGTARHMEIDGAVDNANRLRALIPAISNMIADEYANFEVPPGAILLMFAVLDEKGGKHVMLVALKHWPDLSDEFFQQSAKVPHEFIWGLLCKAVIERNEPAALGAFLARIGASGIAELEEDRAKFSKQGFQPVIVTMAEDNPSQEFSLGVVGVHSLPDFSNSVPKPTQH